MAIGSTHGQIVDMFADIEGGQTKAEQETAYQTSLDNNAAKNNRSKRDNLLQETDWWAVSDRTMTSEQTTYRASLRDNKVQIKSFASGS